MVARVEPATAGEPWRADAPDLRASPSWLRPQPSEEFPLMNHALISKEMASSELASRFFWIFGHHGQSQAFRPDRMCFDRATSGRTLNPGDRPQTTARMSATTTTSAGDAISRRTGNAAVDHGD